MDPIQIDGQTRIQITLANGLGSTGYSTFTCETCGGEDADSGRMYTNEEAARSWAESHVEQVHDAEGDYWGEYEAYVDYAHAEDDWS